MSLDKERRKHSYASLAQLLLVYEAGARVFAANDSRVVSDVCEKLSRVFSVLVGSDGFKALLMRAVSLSMHETPGLESVSVTATGTIEGLGQGSRAAGEYIVVNLLGLMARFIGDPLTLRLLADAWPELSILDRRFVGKEQSD